MIRHAAMRHDSDGYRDQGRHPTQFGTREHIAASLFQPATAQQLLPQAVLEINFQ